MSTSDADYVRPDALPAASLSSSPRSGSSTSNSTGKEVPVGYAALLQDLGITGYVPVHQSVLAGNSSTRGGHEQVDGFGRVSQVLPGATAVRRDGMAAQAIRLRCL